MNAIFPTIDLKDEHKHFLKEPVNILMQHIEQFEQKKQYGDQYFDNTLFALSLSCFQKLDLYKIFKRKTEKKYQYNNNYNNSLSIHNKEIEKRGFQVIQTLNSSKIEENINNLFNHYNKSENDTTTLNNNSIFQDHENIFIKLNKIFNELKNNHHIPSTFQTAYILYNLKEDLSPDDKDIINDLLNFCIKQNFLFAEHFQGILMLEGFYEDKNFDDAIKHLMACGKKGFSASYCLIGDLYEEKDFYKSIYYFDLAYKTGDIYAATMLGYIYINKLLLNNEPSEIIPQAIKYLEYAAKKGSVDAKYMLGVIYYEDYGNLGVKTENYEKAVFYLSSIEKEKIESLTLLGHIYFKLIFDPKYYHHPMNEKFLKMSAKELKNFKSKNLLLFKQEHNSKNTTFDNHPGISLHTQYCLYYLSQGVNADLIQCFYYLGFLFGKGVEGRIPANKEQCLSLLQKGSDSGSKECAGLLTYFNKEFNTQ